MVMNSQGMFTGAKPHDRATRPATMQHGPAQTTPEITLKFHHMISWDCLRDVWQGLIEHQRWDGIEAFLNATGVPGAQTARAALQSGGTLDAATDAIALEKVSWPAWNIVQGPGNRADEGGSDVDLFVHGVPDIFKERMTLVDLLWIEMKAFLGKLDRPKMAKRREATKTDAAAPVVQQSDSGPVNDAAAGVTRALIKVSKLREASYVPYVHSMWQVVGYGRVDPSAPAAWIGGIYFEPRYEKSRAARTPGNLPAAQRCQACRQTYVRPPVPPGTLIQCTMCKGRTYVDFKNAA